MRRTVLALLALTAPVALLAACGDDDDGGGGSGVADDHVAAWTANLTDAEDGLAVADDDAECMAEALVDGLGTERFEDADVTVEDIEAGASPGELLGDGGISEDDARAVLDEWGDCTDLDRLLAESSAEAMGLEAEGVDCLAGALEDEGIAEELLVASFTTEDGQPEQGAYDRFVAAASQCTSDG